MLFSFAFFNTGSKAGRSAFVTLLLCLSFTFPLTLCLNMWFLFLTVLHFVCAFCEIWSCLQCFLQVQCFSQDIWDREEWHHLDSTFRQMWWVLHLKCKVLCPILILKFLYKRYILLGSGHLVHLEISILRDRRMDCKGCLVFLMVLYLYTQLSSFPPCLLSFLSTHPESSSVIFSENYMLVPDWQS